jgi:hypothetical protein
MRHRDVVHAANIVSLRPAVSNSMEQLTLTALRGYFGARDSTSVLGRRKVVESRVFLTLCELT